MQKSGGMNGYVVGGALLGLALMFRPVRLILACLVLYLSFLYFQDKWSETWVDGSDTSVYSLEIGEYRHMDISFYPYYEVDISVKNISDWYMQEAYMTAVLYECPFQTSNTSECQAIAEKNVYYEIDQRPGFLFRKTLNLDFSNAGEFNRNKHYLIELTMDRINFDKDRHSL